MSNLKPVASWLSTAFLLFALYFTYQTYFPSQTPLIGPLPQDSAVLCFAASIALSLWNPPAKPGK